MTHQPPSYHGYRFPPEIISHAVWLYHRFCLSFRDAEDLPLLQRGIAGDVLGQDFDGDRAVEAGIAGFVDLAHAASAEGGDDLIRTKPNAGGERHDPPGERNREPAGL